MYSMALDEVKAIKQHWLIWYTLGFQDIQLRYRRSALGPLWLTLSTAVMIYSMGFLYSHLFKLDLHQYFPYLASGFICWQYIATLLNESSNAYIDAMNYLQNQRTFYSLFEMRIVLRNLLIFAHNFLAFIPIALIFHTGFGWHSLMLFPGLILLSVNGFFWGSVIAALSTRYRDIQQIVGSIIQVVFFVTPVMWMPSLLPERVRWFFDWNPFAQFLAIIRAPLMNQPVSSQAFLVVSLITLLGIYLYMVVMSRVKNRLVFWL